MFPCSPAGRADFSRHELEALMRAAFQAGHTAALGVFDSAPHSYVFPFGSRQVGQRQGAT